MSINRFLHSLPDDVQNDIFFGRRQIDEYGCYGCGARHLAISDKDSSFPATSADVIMFSECKNCIKQEDSDE